MFDRGNVGFKPVREEAYLKGLNVTLRQQDLLQRARQSPRMIREMDNWVNLNWFAGRPYFRRIPTSATVVGLNPDRRQNFVYANLAFDVVRTISGVMFYEPACEASPRTQDQEDIARAHVAAELANSAIESAELGGAYSRVAQMCNLYGHAWIKAPWDPTAGNHKPLFNQVACDQCQATGIVWMNGFAKACPKCGTEGVLPGQARPPAPPGYISEFGGMKPEGDIAYYAIHPDDIYTDPDARCPGDAEELLHHIRMSPERAYRCYGEPLGIPFEVFQRAPLGNEMMGSYRTSSAVVLMRPTNLKYISVREYYWKPCAEYPMGVFSVHLSDQEIYSGPLPYLHDSKQWHPYFYFPMYETDGMYYPQSTLDLVLPLIITYNEHLSSKNARAKISAKLRMAYHEQTKMRMDDQTGHLIYGGRNNLPSPQPVQLAPYPQDAETMQNTLLAMVDRISSATEVLRGANQNADSARALTFLEEHAIGPLKPVIAKHARVLDMLVKWTVDLCRVFYDDGRLIRRLGKAGSQEAFEFRAENVGESVDVRLRTVRDVGRSRASKIDELNEALKNGGITPDQYQQYAEFGDIDMMYQDLRAHSDFACMENKMLQTGGQMPAPLKYQNHKLHKVVHSKELVTMQMRNPQDPLIPWLVQHMEMHTQLEAEEAIAPQMAQQMAMQNYGAMNAANPQFQPAETQAQVAAQPTGGAPSAAPTMEPYSNQPPAEPGQSAAYQSVAEQARTYDVAQQG